MTLRQVASVGRLVVLCGALLCSGCGTTLLVSEVSFTDSMLAQLRRGGVELGCHERASQVFSLFLVCPGPDHALGIAPEQGKVAISCPDRSHRACRKWLQRVRSAGRYRPKQPAASPAGEER